MQTDRRSFIRGLLAIAAVLPAMKLVSTSEWHQYVFKSSDCMLQFWAKGRGGEGRIDDLRIYGRLLTSDEVLQLYAIDGKVIS